MILFLSIGDEAKKGKIEKSIKQNEMSVLRVCVDETELGQDFWRGFFIIHDILK
jgi:hypothetical protein